MRIFLAASFVVFTFSFLQAADNADFKKGAAAYIAGNSDEAMLLLYKAHRANPSDKKTKALLAEVYLDQASKAMGEGDYVAASKYVNEAEKLKLLEGKIIGIKKSLKALTAKEKPKVRKPSKRAPKKKKLPKKEKDKAPEEEIKKTVKTGARKKAAAKESVSPIIIKEKIIERSAKAMSWQKQTVIAAAALLPLMLIAFIFFKLYVRERSKEENLLNEKQAAEKRLQKETEALKESAAKLKAELAAEKTKKKAEAPLNYSRLKSAEKEQENKELKKRLEIVEDSLNAVRTESAKKRTPSPPAVEFEGEVSLDKKYFLPTYTEVPLDASALSEMLERASGLSARLNLLWALGNKTDLSAVETLESHLSKAKGEEYREILKSLKKIALRPELSAGVRKKIEDIFSSQRRRGIII